VVRTKLDIYVFIDNKSVYLPGGRNPTDRGTSGLDKRKIYEYGLKLGIFTLYVIVERHKYKS
jgi:hypothetical protein